MIVGVITTVMPAVSVEATPDTVITPVVSATEMELAYFVPSVVPQLEKFVAVDVPTISDMQVRPALAANTTSEPFARLV